MWMCKIRFQNVARTCLVLFCFFKGKGWEEVGKKSGNYNILMFMYP
jgi:hypothetical protein